MALTGENIQRHNSSDLCWVIVHGKWVVDLEKVDLPATLGTKVDIPFYVTATGTW
jgi:hypothetical protein